MTDDNLWQPTCVLRLVNSVTTYRDFRGTEQRNQSFYTEQKWINIQNGDEEWRPLPVVVKLDGVEVKV